MPFKIPMDAYVVAVPMVYACAALGGLVFKTLTADPEMSTQKYYDNTPEEVIAAQGQKWNDGIKSLFDARIKAHRTGVFNNEVKPQ